MARYIDADKFIKDLQSEYHGMISDESLKIYKIIHRLDNEPTADVVEVVRCKECKYWINKHGGFCQASNALSEVNNENNDFCSYGERRTDND